MTKSKIKAISLYPTGYLFIHREYSDGKSRSHMYCEVSSQSMTRLTVLCEYLVNYRDARIWLPNDAGWMVYPV